MNFPLPQKLYILRKKGVKYVFVPASVHFTGSVSYYLKNYEAEDYQRTILIK